MKTHLARAAGLVAAMFFARQQLRRRRRRRRSRTWEAKSIGRTKAFSRACPNLKSATN